MGDAKAAPLKSSGLHISVFQDKSERWAINMFKNMFEKAVFYFLDKPWTYTSRTYFQTYYMFHIGNW